MIAHIRPARRGAGRFACGAAGILLAAVVGGATLAAEDWPQWRGAERLGVWTETGILREFPDEGLIVKGRVPVRAGFDYQEHFRGGAE